MAPDAAPILPDDLYATQEEAGGAAPPCTEEEKNCGVFF